MSTVTRKQALNELEIMFPDYERTVLDAILRSNGKNTDGTMYTI